MAKSDKQELVKKEESLAEALGFGFSERPDFIPEGDKSGTEGIGRDDVRMPRLTIAQSTSKEMIPGNSLYMPDLRMFELFNDTTKEIYGKGPLFFIPVLRKMKGIEFKPMSEGGGVVDMNVPLDDPRMTEWRTVEGGRLPPPATAFNDYLFLLLMKDPDGGAEPLVQPVGFSIKMTNKHNRRAAQDLNGFIKMYASQGAKSVPIYGVIYSLETRPETNDKGTFGVPGFKAAGFIPKSMPGLYEKAREAHLSMKDKDIVVDRGRDQDEIVDGEVMDDKAPF